MEGNGLKKRAKTMGIRRERERERDDVMFGRRGRRASEE